MGDLHFKCLGCQQSLVADESGAGVSFLCPHCNTAQIIPPHATAVPPAPAPSAPALQDDAPAAPQPPQAAQPAPGPAPADAGLWIAQERLWKNEHQSAEQAIALVERDQRISALRAECDWLSSQLDEERQRRQTLDPELDLARGGWAAAEKRAGELETTYHQASIRLRQAEISVEELGRQVELLKTERSDAILDLANHQETLAELNLQLGQARAERAETEQILARARLDLERAVNEQALAETAAEQSAAEAGQLNAALAHLRAELGMAVTERDKLQSLVREDHELAEFVQVKVERDQLEYDFRETQSRLSDLREKVDSLTAERDILRRERTDLQLTVAALRDAHDDTQLQQDNEVLRRMVERLNEELKELRPDSARRKRRDAPGGGVVGGLARAVASRVFIPDPDVAEGQ